MADYSELKRLADRVIAIEATQDEPIQAAYDEFEAAANPAAVLALVAEIVQAKADGADAFGLAQARADQVDRLKGEVEALRKNAERYRWLRDSDRLSLWAEHLVCDEPRRSNGIDKHIDAAMNQESSN